MDFGRGVAQLVRFGEKTYGYLRARYEAAVMSRRYGFPRQAGGVVMLSDLGLEGEGRHDYSASPIGTLKSVLVRSEVSTDDVFLDLGCGMGHVLLEAAELGFRRAIGVEIAPDFVVVAREAVARNRRLLTDCDIEVVTGDVVTYEVPDDVTVAYFSNPFDAGVARTVVGNIVASVRRRPRPVRIVYFDPPHDLALDQVNGIRLVRYGRRPIRRWRPAEYLRLYELTPADD